MHKTLFRNLDNSQIWDKIIDKRFNHILLHRFNPRNHLHWWQTSIKINNVLLLENALVREMNFDLLTDLNTLEKILKLNTNYLYIYQFNKPVPDTLLLSDLPEETKEIILMKNGLQHIIMNELEDTIVESIDAEFINRLEEYPDLEDNLIL